MLRGSGPNGSMVDISKLASDLEFILMDKAKVGSDILHIMMNVKKHGGVRMYAEVYEWFTETSGLGLAEQANSLMHPKQAAKEERIPPKRLSCGRRSATSGRDTGRRLTSQKLFGLTPLRSS